MIPSFHPFLQTVPTKTSAGECPHPKRAFARVSMKTKSVFIELLQERISRASHKPDYTALRGRFRFREVNSREAI